MAEVKTKNFKTARTCFCCGAVRYYVTTAMSVKECSFYSKSCDEWNAFHDVTKDQWLECDFHWNIWNEKATMTFEQAKEFL